MSSRRHPTARGQRGSMLVFGAGILLFLSSFAVFAVDIGRIFIVRGELQNVADAAALAGANCLTRQDMGGSTVDCSADISTTINWARATAKAQDHLGRNHAAGVPIDTSGDGHTIEVGYWNLLTRQPSGGSFSTTYAPLTVNDKPAVRVTVRKDTGVNNGPISMLSRIFGGPEGIPMSAEAVAVISAPSMVNPGTLLPYVISSCMFERFWDTETNSPVIYTGSPPDPYGHSIVGQPWIVRIGNAYHYDTCWSGQWTTFDLNSNSAQTVRNLINNGNSGELNIGDLTWVNPGVQNANYNDINQRYPDMPVEISLAVVENADLSHLPPGGRQLEIEAFAGFRLMESRGGSHKYILGQFIPSNVTSGGGVGPSFGTFTPPRIAH